MFQRKLLQKTNFIQKPFFFFFGCPGSAVRRLSLVAVSKSYSFFALHGILIVVASVIVEQGLSSCGTQA